MEPKAINQSELNSVLRNVRTQARENGGRLEYSALKEAFAGADLTVQQTGMVWNFLDQNCILVMNIDEYDDFFRKVPESEPEGSELNNGMRNDASAPAVKKEQPAEETAPKKGFFARLLGK